MHRVHVALPPHPALEEGRARNNPSVAPQCGGQRISRSADVRSSADLIAF